MKEDKSTGRRPAAQGRPVILDFDGSVLPLGADEIRIPLGEWQENIRFGCAMARYAALAAHLDARMPSEHGCVFTGSGDYHHLTLYLLRRAARRLEREKEFLDLIVCDNHPDNMRYPFGLHCGSWVSHAAKISRVRRIHVIGITSADIGPAHAWENSLLPFVHKKLFYWSIGRRAAWLNPLGRKSHGRSFNSAQDLVAAFAPVLQESAALYLSIDKDVLDPAVARTNWDQGQFAPEHIEAIAQGCSGRLTGCDITGDASVYAYTSWWKRLLSRLDGQGTPDAATLNAWRIAQQEINTRLLKRLAP